MKKRLRFVADRIDIEAAAGEISCAAFNAKSGGLDLAMADPTDLVKTVRLAVQGLRPGGYEVGHEGSKERHDVRDILMLDLPFERAKTIQVRRAP